MQEYGIPTASQGSRTECKREEYEAYARNQMAFKKMIVYLLNVCCKEKYG